MPSQSYLFEGSFESRRSGKSVENGLRGRVLTGVSAADVWMDNSLQVKHEPFTTSFKALIYATLVLTILIFIHSNYIHYEKGYRCVRLCTEVGAVALMISSCLLLSKEMMGSEDPTNWVLSIDFFYYGVLTLLIQLCDNRMFYQTLKASTKINQKIRVSLCLYVIFILVLSWIPAYTVVPFFYDTNTEYFMYWKGIGVNIRTWGHILFNFTLSYHGVFQGKCGDFFNNKLFTMKNILHPGDTARSAENSLQNSQEHSQDSYHLVPYHRRQ